MCTHMYTCVQHTERIEHCIAKRVSNVFKVPRSKITLIGGTGMPTYVGRQNKPSLFASKPYRQTGPTCLLACLSACPPATASLPACQGDHFNLCATCMIYVRTLLTFFQSRALSTEVHGLNRRLRKPWCNMFRDKGENAPVWAPLLDARRQLLGIGHLRCRRHSVELRTSLCKARR